MSKYLANRQFPRLVPQNSIPVSIHDGEHGQAFALITNLSEGGASFASGVSYRSGSKILLRISFDRDAEPFVTEGTVAWSREEEGKKKGFVHGVKFSILEEEQVKQLRTTLQRPEFKVVFRPHREFPRLVPRESIEVSIADAQSKETKGAMINISEGGASFASNTYYGLGSNVLMRIGFDRESPFVTEARIVWTREGDDSAPSMNADFLYGARFALLEEQQRRTLEETLKRPEFKVIYHPHDESGSDLPGAPRTELQTKSTTAD
ncbi:MAG: PilZ domain-containing protein [Vicinamibacteria bacterium]